MPQHSTESDSEPDGSQPSAPNPTQLPIEPEFGPGLAPAEPEKPGVTPAEI